MTDAHEPTSAPEIVVEPDAGADAETPLDRALRRAGGDAADGRAVDALMGSELLLLLEAPLKGDRMRPVILELEAGATALAFDTEARLAAFGGGSDYAEINGLALARLLGAQGVNLAVNPGVAPSELFHEAAALTWMAESAEAETRAEAARVGRLGPPRAATEALVAALDGRLAALATYLAEAWLVQAAAPEAPAGGKDGAEETAPTLLMILRERPGLDLAGKKALDMAAEARREAMVSALARSARLAAPEGPDFATMFVEETAPALAAARRFGLGFELPEPEAPRATGPSAPGMDPARPPKLR
ncbi:MAG: hypothetical protein CML46_17965 [Rhodobacteraceae bacterium]|nr:hypothetical protein [Paracoccaceae bacterium]MBR28803.1 hypothetical protein [Paracoccaceae bacterium]